MREHWILIFAYHFPPENSIGGARPYRFYKYLPRHGFKCHVITAADVSTRPDLDAEYVSDPFIARQTKGFQWHVERSIRKILLPGVTGIQWAQRAFRTAVRFVDQHPHDQITVLSTFPPLGPHLAGWALARRKRLCWIADFRDPLAGNPVNSRLGWQTHAFYEWLERRFIRCAHAVIANTDEAERVLKLKYPQQAGRIHLLWNGFDPEERIQALPVPERPFRILTHVGELYEGRTATPLLQSIARLIAAGRLQSNRIVVQLVGPVQSSCLPDRAFIQRAEGQGWLKIVPIQIPKSDAQRLAQTSEGLLIIQPQSAIQVPGKLFEYLQIGRPILAFLPRQSSIERVLEKSGIPYKCIYAGDPVETFDETVLSFFHLPNEARKPSAWFDETFNGDSQTATLVDVIRNL